ncbi:patatin-like phospholipase family protein [Piscinibacter sp.]|jgi:NTE family protein|uniref:patatin-like phospholipase family protein n=1 Tax=Piscinibacter sp. TaxID=1903157 RepID=UPI0035593CC1
MPEIKTTGLILTGGGARAAYQVGVLDAVAHIRRSCDAPPGNPFPVIAGTSAGAINSTALACQADDFDAAVAGLVHVWRHFHAEQVYRSDSIGVIRSGANWLTMMSLGWVIARWRRARPRSLLDNSPLNTLLGELIDTARLKRVMRDGHLQALAVTASSYGSGMHVTFYDAVKDIVPWTRSQRIAVRSDIGVPHLLASSAIPFVFPAIPLDLEGHIEYFGDGSMRQSAPISPAVHLGAQRILVVGAGRMHEPPGERAGSGEYPNLAQIAGHALSNIFLDALAVDVERLQRINSTLSLLPPEARARTSLRPIEVLVIAPSQRLDDLAAKHLGSLPVPIRALLRGVGVSGRGDDARGAALASYLLFESPYTRELIRLGRADTYARRDEVMAFFGWRSRNAPEPIPAMADTNAMPL